MAELLTPGERKIELRMEGGAELPYSIEVTYNALKPDSSPETQVALEVSLAKTALTEGEPTEARVLVANKTDEKLPTAVAIFGVPGGLEVRHDQLKELVKKKTVDAYEVIGRDVVLYWRGMEPRKTHRRAAVADGGGARHVHGPGQPRVPVLHGRAQDVAGRGEGVHRAEAITPTQAPIPSPSGRGTG